jgi:hypothetical protein
MSAVSAEEYKRMVDIVARFLIRFALVVLVLLSFALGCIQGIKWGETWTKREVAEAGAMIHDGKAYRVIPLVEPEAQRGEDEG